MPVLKKIFNPKNHSFLKFGNIYIGDSDCFSRLMDSVLVTEGFNTCLAYTNPESPVDSKIIGEFRKGILSSTDSKACLYYMAKNIPEDELNSLQLISLSDSI